MKYIDKNIQKEIQDKFFKNYKILGKKFVLTQKSSNKFFALYPMYHKTCENILINQPKFSTLRNVLYFILLDKDLAICKNCNNEINFNYTIRNAQYCSHKCANSDKELCKKKTQTMFKTNIDKYGYKVAMLIPENRKKQKEASNSKTARIKAFNTKREKTKERWNNRLKAAETKYNITLQNDSNEFFDIFLNDPLYQFKWKCNKCGSIFMNRFTDKKGILCCKCHKLNGSSLEEHSMKDYIISLVGLDNVVTRKMILKANSTTRFQIDVYIPKLKLGFEYNGLYYHQYTSERNNMHLYKTLLAEENDIRLVHIRSDMWLNDNRNTKMLIKNIIQNNINFSPYTNPVILTLDRSIFNKAWRIPGYILEHEVKPKILQINLDNRQYNYQDCGQLIYKKDLKKCII